MVGRLCGAGAPGTGRAGFAVDIGKRVALALLLALFVETSSYLAGRVLAGRGFVYRAESPTQADYERYLADRDPLVGWPGRRALDSEALDASGSRLVPRFPDPDERSCVALFGDSFTFGDEVAHEHAYGNVLSGLLGCRVANYGMGGYGTDQAYLRFRDVIRDRAPVVVLGHYSSNVVRNVNRLRAFLGGPPLRFKPRFVLDPTGELELVPLADLAELGRLPELLAHDYFRPGGGAGTVELRFPYTLSVGRVLGHYRLRSWLRAGPSYSAFYDPEHPSGALQVTSAIIRAFVRDARDRAQTPIVILIPDVKDLIERRARRPASYRPLEDSLAQSGIETPGVARRLLAAIGDRRPGTLYVRGRRGGHFTPEGNALLARILFEWMQQRQIGRPLTRRPAEPPH